MHERLQPANETPKKVSEENVIRNIDNLIADKLESLAGLKNIDSWNKEYMDLPEDLSALEEFYARLQNEVLQKREDALLSIEFAGEFSESEKEDIRRLDREVRAALKDHENFLGNGATAEVYALAGDNVMCVKFITDKDNYNENNHLRVEFGHLLKVWTKTQESKVRTPHPIFLRIHPNEGHSYGMEKIRGGSLSQILESPQKYQELVALAKSVDRTQAEHDLMAFVEEMHEAGVIHGDLYTRNIMFDESGRLFVIDFGKAKIIDFEGGRPDERKHDLYVAQQSIRSFFSQLDSIDNKPN
jgi:tRNA A-37 threonylcarbamoyl transferase component Bud32